jgi:hypothetical protein
VFSFGTIELIEGIIIVDADLKYKTFEKEYSEVLNQSDKNIKRLLKNAFDKGEYTIDDSALEKSLLNILDQLVKYDNPSFNFIESFDPSMQSVQSEITVNDILEDENIGDEPAILTEPPILKANSEPEVITPVSEKSVTEPPTAEQGSPEPTALSEDVNSELDSEVLGAADLQDALTSMDLGADIQEPGIVEIPIEEIPITDVEAQSKGVASNFFVQMTEEGQFTLDPQKQIKHAEVKGQLLLKNLGKEDRIWDINIRLDNIKATTLKENNYHINELGPDKTWETEYNVKGQKELPLLFEERIFTSPKKIKPNPTLIPNQKTMLEFVFHLENSDQHSIINIQMEKEIPEIFTDLKLLGEIPPNTELNVSDHKIKWKILNLEPKQEIELKIQAKIIPTTTKSVKTGSVQISFTQMSNFYSDIILEDISSISKNMYYIEKDEQERNPGQWTCRLIFENRSEFPLLLENAEIFSGSVKSEQKATVFRAINEIIGPADNEWTSEDWVIISEAIPTFGKTVKFKIIPSTTISFIANVKFEEVELPIIWAEVKKSYSTDNVASYSTTPITIESTITNLGAAQINDITIEEFIPENFTPPSIKDIEILLDGKTLTPSEQKLNFKIDRIPDSEDSSQPHQIFFELKALNNSIGTIETNSELKIIYRTKAVNPPPDKIFNFPITVTCNTDPPESSLKITPDMVSIPEISVTHKRRKLTVGKSVSPGSAPGEYEIEMVFKNRGNTPIENAVISDLVPVNFSVIDSQPEAKMSKLDEETILEWNFEHIEPGKKIELAYKIKGTGDYKTSDAEIFYKV